MRTKKPDKPKNWKRHAKLTGRKYTSVEELLRGEGVSEEVIQGYLHLRREREERFAEIVNDLHEGTMGRKWTRADVEEALSHYACKAAELASHLELLRGRMAFDAGMKQLDYWMSAWQSVPANPPRS